MKQANIKCPYCGSGAFLRPASVLHKENGAERNAMFYVCARYPSCDAYVRAHDFNRQPMGTLADPVLRRKRQEAHRALRRLWESGLMSKKEAYRWLQTQLDINETDAHGYPKRKSVSSRICRKKSCGSSVSNGHHEKPQR